VQEAEDSLQPWGRHGLSKLQQKTNSLCISSRTFSLAGQHLYILINLLQVGCGEAINTMMQIPSSPVQSPPLTYPSGLDTKFGLPQDWYRSPFNSEETYSLDYSAQNSVRSAANTLLERPQLPLPQLSPAQTSRNVVDQLQDQRLHSGLAIGGCSPSNGGFVKPPLSSYDHNEALPVTLASQFDFSTSSLFAPALPAYSNCRDSQEYKPRTFR
jgi:hypothetical protein